MSYENYAPPRSRVEVLPTESGAIAPPLWNPGISANICLLVPIALGAWLQARNWEALGQPGKARFARFWVIADAIFVAFWLAAPLLPTRFTIALPPMSLLMLVIWYYSSAKPQIRFVQDTYGKHYPRRNWGGPLLVGLTLDVVIVGIGRLS